MAGPVVEADGNEHVAVDVEWFSQPLGEHINDVVITVRAVVELDTKCALPFLALQDVLGIGSMKEEAFKLDLTHAGKPWSRFQGGIDVIA